MKTLGDLLNTFKKEPTLKDWLNNELLAEEFDETLGYFDLSDKGLESYYHPEVHWICTDTRVGIKFFYLFDKLVAISFQQARKSDEVIEWTSEEAFKETRAWFRKVRQEQEEPLNPKLFDLSEDISSYIEAKNFNDTYSRF